MYVSNFVPVAIIPKGKAEIHQPHVWNFYQGADTIILSDRIKSMFEIDSRTPGSAFQEFLKTSGTEYKPSDGIYVLRSNGGIHIGVQFLPKVTAKMGEISVPYDLSDAPGFHFLKEATKGQEKQKQN